MCSGNTKVVSKIVKSQFLELADLLTVNLQAVKQEPQMSIFPIHMSFVSYYLLLLYFFIVITYADNIDIAETENRENPYVGAKKKKEDGGPIASSEISATCSEKLNLSRKQFFHLKEENNGRPGANPCKWIRDKGENDM